MLKSARVLHPIASAIAALLLVAGHATPAQATYGGVPASAARPRSRGRDAVCRRGAGSPGPDRVSDSLRDGLCQRTGDRHGNAVSNGLSDRELHSHEAGDGDFAMSTVPTPS